MKIEAEERPLRRETLHAIFRPRSVAVIGASTRPGAIGRVIFEKLLQSGFNGPVYPVHPKAAHVHSVRAYRSILEVPEPVDLAVIAVKREMVLDVAGECARAGVKGLIVITAGFREVGGAGVEMEQRLLQIVRDAGMRMVGPNCMGVICTDPEVQLDATFAPTVPRPGRIGFVSQSGALGVAILEYAARLNLGVSMFISIGNKADIAGNDVLDYWQDDPSVEVILMYLESFGRPQQFVRLARTISRRKPIIIVKSGRTQTGARAAASHTGALAGTDVLFDAMFAQCGITRADTIEEMFDFAMGFANQPLPAGRRVAIITNAGGPGILAADACENHGLELPALSEATLNKLRPHVSPEASLRNPVDLLAGATETEFKYAVQCVLQDEHIDGVIVIFVPPVVTDPIKVAQSISEAMENSQKPVMGCFMGVKGIAGGVKELQKHHIPAYTFPESAVKTFRAMYDYARWKQRREKPAPVYQVEKEKASEVIERALGEGRKFLSDMEGITLLRCYGIPFASTSLCHSLDEVLAAARKLRYQVVLKLSAPTIIHKTEYKAVKTGIYDEKGVRKAYAELMRVAQSLPGEGSPYGILVQQAVQGGREVMMGIHHAPRFGPLVAFGLGGIWVEVFKDVCLRLAPLTEDLAEEMIESIQGYPILRGIRGEAPVAFETLKEVLLRLSQLACDFPQITELDLNPFMAFAAAEQCMAVDVRCKVQMLQ